MSPHNGPAKKAQKIDALFHALSKHPLGSKTSGSNPKMSYLVLNPEFQRLETELRAMDCRRDHLRAQMADAAMRAELEEISTTTRTFWLSPEIRQARVEALAEKIRKRAQRRAAEMRRYGSYTRPGTWDKDLDDYQEPRYEEEASDGYKIRLVRDYGLTWRGYVILPEGHPFIGKHYEFFGGYEAPAGMPQSPQHLTYGGDSYAERGVYGFYLTNTVTPRDDETRYDSFNYYSVEKTGFSITAPNGSVYVDYAYMRGMCLELVDYFKGLAADPSVLSPPPAQPEPEPEAEPVQYFTSMRAPPARRAVMPQTAPASAVEPPKPKKSWAAVVGGK